MSKSKALWLRYVCLGGIILAGGVAWWRAANPPIERSAKDLLGAIFRSDVDQILRYSSSQEREWVVNNRQTLELILNRLVKPRLNGTRMRSDVSVTVADDLSDASAMVMLQGTGGRTFPIYAKVYWTAGGPKSSSIQSALMAAWTAEYHSTKSGQPRVSETFVALREGLTKDRPFLESVGAKGFYNVTMIPWMKSNHRTFDDYLAHWTRLEKIAKE
jgi:hypothetical protein